MKYWYTEVKKFNGDTTPCVVRGRRPQIGKLPNGSPSPYVFVTEIDEETASMGVDFARAKVGLSCDRCRNEQLCA